MMHGKHTISNSSGMSKTNDPRKRCPSPITGGKNETTMQKVSGAGRSNPGAPTKNARKVQPKPSAEGKYEVTMVGRKKR